MKLLYLVFQVAVLVILSAIVAVTVVIPTSVASFSSREEEIAASSWNNTASPVIVPEKVTPPQKSGDWDTNNESNVQIVSVSVELWDVTGVPIEVATSSRRNRNNDTFTMAKASSTPPPRYLVGKASLVEKQNYSLESSIADDATTLQHFTFDLGNPGYTTFVVKECLGCSPKYETNHTLIGSPDKVPTCNDESSFSSKNYYDDHLPKDVCWPSHSNEGWYLDDFKVESNIECSSLGDRVQESGTLHIPNKEIKTCRMCFDHGNHSRFFTPLVTDDNDNKNSTKNHIAISLAVSKNEEKEIVSSHSSEWFWWMLPINFHFGGLVRTIPLQDRIWSNVGIGYNSSFLQQTFVGKLHFALRRDCDTTSYIHFHSYNSQVGHDTSNIVESNISSSRTKDYGSGSRTMLTQSYRTPHHRIHTLQGFRTTVVNDTSKGTAKGNNNKDLFDASYERASKSLSGQQIKVTLRHQRRRRLVLPATSTSNNLPLLHEFIMDTGNGGICIDSNNTLGIMDHVANITGGTWRRPSGGNMMGGQQILYLNNLDDSSNIQKSLEVVFRGNMNHNKPNSLDQTTNGQKNSNGDNFRSSSGVVVTMAPNMWITNRMTGETIFMTCDLNVLGLPFMSSGLDLIFDDQRKQLEMFGPNVHIEEEK